MKAQFQRCRSYPDAFQWYHGKDGRRGRVCSTKLGGDWVLAESEQVAPSCSCKQVLRAYLDGRLQRRWSADKVISVVTTRRRSKGKDPCYQQDLLLHSQRVVGAHGVQPAPLSLTVPGG